MENPNQGHTNPEAQSNSETPSERKQKYGLPALEPIEAPPNIIEPYKSQMDLQNRIIRELQEGKLDKALGQLTQHISRGPLPELYENLAELEERFVRSKLGLDDDVNLRNYTEDNYEKVRESRQEFRSEFPEVHVLSQYVGTSGSAVHESEVRATFGLSRENEQLERQPPRKPPEPYDVRVAGSPNNRTAASPKGGGEASGSETEDKQGPGGLKGFGQRALARVPGFARDRAQQPTPTPPVSPEAPSPPPGPRDERASEDPSPPPAEQPPSPDRRRTPQPSEPPSGERPPTPSPEQERTPRANWRVEWGSNRVRENIPPAMNGEQLVVHNVATASMRELFKNSAETHKPENNGIGMLIEREDSDGNGRVFSVRNLSEYNREGLFGAIQDRLPPGTTLEAMKQARLLVCKRGEVTVDASGKPNFSANRYFLVDADGNYIDPETSTTIGVEDTTTDAIIQVGAFEQAQASSITLTPGYYGSRLNFAPPRFETAPSPESNQQGSAEESLNRYTADNRRRLGQNAARAAQPAPRPQNSESQPQPVNTREFVEGTANQFLGSADKDVWNAFEGIVARVQHRVEKRHLNEAVRTINSVIESRDLSNLIVARTTSDGDIKLSRRFSMSGLSDEAFNRYLDTSLEKNKQGYVERLEGIEEFTPTQEVPGERLKDIADKVITIDTGFFQEQGLMYRNVDGEKKYKLKQGNNIEGVMSYKYSEGLLARFGQGQGSDLHPESGAERLFVVVEDDETRPPMVRIGGRVAFDTASRVGDFGCNIVFEDTQSRDEFVDALEKGGVDSLATALRSTLDIPGASDADKRRLYLLGNEANRPQVFKDVPVVVGKSTLVNS